jgi:hypothetical protein
VREHRGGAEAKQAGQTAHLDPTGGDAHEQRILRNPSETAPEERDRERAAGGIRPADEGDAPPVPREGGTFERQIAPLDEGEREHRVQRARHLARMRPEVARDRPSVGPDRRHHARLAAKNHATVVRIGGRDPRRFVCAGASRHIRQAIGVNGGDALKGDQFLPRSRRGRRLRRAIAPHQLGDVRDHHRVVRADSERDIVDREEQRLGVVRCNRAIRPHGHRRSPLPFAPASGTQFPILYVPRRASTPGAW